MLKSYLFYILIITENWIWTQLCRFKFIAKLKILQLQKLIPSSDVERHMYLTGMTGSGKSTFLEQWVYGKRLSTSNKEDCSIIFMDPHGDSVEKLKKSDLASQYFERMVYIDPLLRKGFTPCINPLEVDNISYDNVELHAQILVDIFEELIPEAKLSNYMRSLLMPCITTLLIHKNCSLKDLQEMIQEEKGTKRLEKGKQSQILPHRSFFQTEFNHSLYKYTKNSIYTKLQSLLNIPLFYNFVTGHSTINLNQCTRQGKIVLVNLSKGRLGEQVCATIGKFIIGKIKSIALSRAQLPNHLRKPIYLVIDEADLLLYRNKNISTILQETRKYGLHLIVSTQSLVSGIGQEKLRRNIMNNTNVKIIGMNGLSTLNPICKDVGIPIQRAQKLHPFQFLIAFRTKRTKKVKLRQALSSNSPLILKKGKIQGINHRIIKSTPYYKPIIEVHSHPNQWIDDLPLDWHDDILSKELPTPKFTF